ncbi:pilus assembly FimT family protein [Alteromonas sp. 14N.309.X.WAT.G.H12]|uniref:pilus assembly FimT family protein n=1 Tax=Alteromonas sp. 14N.309.X.WAT.G.H12 TaxID=3120824 RepID=UPI002FD48545
MNKHTNKQKGFTMIEIMVALAIMLIGVAVIAPLMNDYFNSSKVSNEISAMRGSMQNLTRRYQREPITSDVDNQEMIESGMLSSNYRTSGTDVIYNIFDGIIEINGVDDNGYTWESSGIDEDVCSEFAESARSLPVDLIQIGGEDYRYSESGNSDFTSACVSAAESSEGDTVTLTWTREEN